jgi:ribosomal protein S12 methylthiotransferase accessory factor
MVPPELFAKAAQALRGTRDVDDEIEALLLALGYGVDDDDQAEPELRQRRAALLSLAGRLNRIFQLHAPTAPGFVFFGAEVSPDIAGPLHANGPLASVTGKGTTLRQAFEGCVGEAAEFLSQLETDDDEPTRADEGEALALLDGRSRDYVANLVKVCSTGRPIDWLAATRLSDGAPALLPVDLVLRRNPSRRALQIPFLLGAGTGAGPTHAAALAHALLELIERDAIGLWWKGGRRGQSVDLRDPRFAKVAQLLRNLRRDRRDRKTWLLDISTDLGVPTIVAVSCSSGGGQFAFGAGAGLTANEAANSALLELCQLELAYEVVQMKLRESSEAALNAFDKTHLTRAESINAERCELLHPAPSGPTASCADPITLSQAIGRAARLGIEIYSTDITRSSWNIAAVRLFAPALQLEPSDIVTERLALAIGETGGGEEYTGGIRLL